MGRTYNKDDWARRRTQVLLRLFRTQAPADFRTSVLRRAQELHSLSIVLPVALFPPRTTLERCRFWLMESVCSTPRLQGLALGLGVAYLLIFVLRPDWAPPQYRISLPPEPEERVAVAQPQEVLPGPDSFWEQAPHDAATLASPANGPVLATGATPSQPASTTRLGMPPLVPPTPWIIDEAMSTARPPLQRAGHKRVLPGKVKRNKKNQTTAKQAPA